MPDPTSSGPPTGGSAASQDVAPGTAAGAAPDAATPAVFPDLGPPQGRDTSKAKPAAASGIDLLRDVNLQVRIELGRTRMLVEDVLRLSPDSVVELDKAAGDPVDIYVNGRHIARGEVLVLNDAFCVRISEIIEPFQAPVEQPATTLTRHSIPKAGVA
jgi:flagellar motor switch protein FliN